MTELRSGSAAGTSVGPGLVAGRTVGIAASAMRWVGRGQSYPALVREIAWIAVRAVGASEDDLDWLSPLVDAQLAERLDQLPRVALDAARLAIEDHLRTCPHDLDGAEAFAEFTAHDAAVEQLSTTYMDLLDWGVGLLQARRAEAIRSGRRRLRPRREPEGGIPVQCEVPQRVLDGLTRRSERPGWPDHRAA